MPSSPLKRSAADGPHHDALRLSKKVPKLEHQAHHHSTFPVTQLPPVPPPPPSQQQQQQQQQHTGSPPSSTPSASGPAPTTPAPSKKKSASAASSRTGQACDRCKNNTECVTTDRITQRANVRGHTEHVEQDNAVLKHHLIELQQQLKDNGIEPKPSPQYVPLQTLRQPQWPHAAAASKGDGRDGEANMFAQLTVGFHNCDGDRYGGVLSANSYLSHIKGTSLSVFGMEVDLADYISDEEDAPMSYAAMMTAITNACPSMTPPAKAKLPETLAECQNIAKTYLLVMNPWLPALHKPDFLRLVNDFYQPGFQPKSAEMATMQMVLAIIKYQNVTRNSDGSQYYRDIREQSFAHYHYALSHLYSLISSRTLADMQAMTMMCIHLRSFPRPGPAWMLTGWAMWICVEMGIHRSSTLWAGNSKKSEVELEIRRRIFWTLTLIHVSISGKLGRPMMLRREDFDVELPQLLPDKFPSEDKGASPECSVWPCVQVFKLTELFLDMYTALYTIRPSSDYETAVQHLERRADQWREELPPALRFDSPDNKDPKCDANARVFALWLRFWESEYQLLMHHPALCRTASQDLISANLQKCINAAWVIIDMFAQAREARILDTTWHNATTFIAAIFTLLFGYWDRRSQISPSELLDLKNRMSLCLDILGEVGRMLGSDERLKTAIRQIIDTGIGHINRFLVEQTASAAVANAGLNKSSQSLQHAMDANSTPYNGVQGYPPSMHQGSQSAQPLPNDNNSYNSTPHGNQTGEYQGGAHGNAYSEPPTTSTVHNTVRNTYNNTYNTYHIPSPADGNPYTAILGNGFAAQAAPPYSTPNHPAYVMTPQVSGAYTSLGPQYSWQRFTESLRGVGPPLQTEPAHVQQPPQEYLAATGALISMGHGNQVSQAGPGAPQVNITGSDASMNGGGIHASFPSTGMNLGPGAAQVWPMSAGYDLDSSGLGPQ